MLIEEREGGGGGGRNGVVYLTIMTLTLELSACSQANKEASLCRGKNHVDFPKIETKRCRNFFLCTEMTNYN